METGYEGEGPEWKPDLAKLYFPFATEEVAARQLMKLIQAKEWMRERDLLACTPNSKFKYVSGGMKEDER